MKKKMTFHKPIGAGPARMWAEMKRREAEAKKAAKRAAAKKNPAGPMKGFQRWETFSRPNDAQQYAADIRAQGLGATKVKKYGRGSFAVWVKPKKANPAGGHVIRGRAKAVKLVRRGGQSVLQIFGFKGAK